MQFNEVKEILTIGLILWGGFVLIVLNSNKYPRINRFFDAIF